MATSPKALYIAIPLTALLITACTSGSSKTSTKTATAAPNPVTLLKKIDGCVFDAGETQGSIDGKGGRYADCSLLDNAGTAGTSFTMYTGANQSQVPSFVTDDDHKIVVGKQFILEITGDFSAYSQGVDVNQIATTLGGTVQQ